MTSPAAPHPPDPPDSPDAAEPSGPSAPSDASEAPDRSARIERRRQGAQLVVAAGLAWLLARVSGLPDSEWAMMSTLIVMRPTAGATLLAGRDRIAGTLAGALCGLAGTALQAWLGARGLPTLALTLALSYVSTAVPAWRSAPITALIVAGSAALDGQDAIRIAGVRVVQILIGIAVALAVAASFLRMRADVRLRRGCRAVLRGQAASLSRTFTSPAPQARDVRQAARRLRESLDRLDALAASADWVGNRTASRRAARRAGKRPVRPADDVETARIDALRCIVADVGLLRRTLRSPSLRGHRGLIADTVRTAARALISVASTMEAADRPEPADETSGDRAGTDVGAMLGALRAWADHCAGLGGEPSRLAGALAALHEDLVSISAPGATGRRT